ncbi:7369_t:CDS:2 [Funneliformis mosseae]|uniref:7369_t:CDS:1 n=1 Tax=Funneliformis mosseae TaxID=27381 RepID=A0A9N9E013_FUNMO|nr:7369_t:CDS:2 [Funneliformis mosseae]
MDKAKKHHNLECYFKQWSQAQSLSVKDKGILKYIDIIGNIELKRHLFQNFFVEVSYGPFYPNPDQHIINDNIKLAKLGKDSLDRNSETVYGDINLKDSIRFNPDLFFL